MIWESYWNFYNLPLFLFGIYFVMIDTQEFMDSRLSSLQTLQNTLNYPELS
jgi:hypothetical protein